MREITTMSGFECQIDEETMDDIRLFDLIRKHDIGTRTEQIAAIPDILGLFMGLEQKEKLYDYLIEKEGRPKISTLEKDISGIIKDLASPKKK